MELLPPSNGHPYILTWINRFTQWPEAFPLIDITTDVVAKAFVSGWTSRFGVPTTVTTDRECQFESFLREELMYLLGFTRCRITAYHPSAYGLVESFHYGTTSAIYWTTALHHVLASPTIITPTNQLQETTTNLTGRVIALVIVCNGQNVSYYRLPCSLEGEYCSSKRGLLLII